MAVSKNGGNGSANQAEHGADADKACGGVLQRILCEKVDGADGEACHGTEDDQTSNT